jgi:O-antigen ligase
MRKIDFMFLWLLIMIMPWEDIFAIPGLTSLAKIFGMIAFGLALISAAVSGRLRFPFALVWIPVFAGWCYISTQWSPNTDMAEQRTLTYLQLLAFVWLICQVTDNPQRLKWLMRACVLGTAVMVANMYAGYVHAGVPLNTEGEVRYSAFGANANAVAWFSNLGILFAFYLITRRGKNEVDLPTWVYWGFIVLAGLAIPLTGSRAGVLSGGVVGFVLLSRMRKLTGRARLGVVICVVLVAVLITQFVGQSTIKRIAEGTSGDTFVERYTAWVYGLKAWKETPVLGTGAGSYDDIMEKQGQRRMAAHNTFVSVLVESGWIGVVLYFAFWAIIIRRVLLLPKADRFFWLGVFASFLPVLLSGSGEYIKTWWLLGAMVLCQGTHPRTAEAKKRRTAPLPVQGPRSTVGIPMPPRPQVQP